MGIYLPCISCGGYILPVKCLAYCKADRISVIENMQITILNVRRFAKLNSQQIDNQCKNNSPIFDDKLELFGVT